MYFYFSDASNNDTEYSYRKVIKLTALHYKQYECVTYNAINKTVEKKQISLIIESMPGNNITFTI